MIQLLIWEYYYTEIGTNKDQKAHMIIIIL